MGQGLNKRSTFLRHFAVLAGLFCGLACGLGAPGPTARAAVFNPESFTLANGMQVVVISNHRAPIVIHMVWYKVGSADEPPGKSGIAHFLEHLLFKGTPLVPPGEFSRIVAKNGGQDNAFTTADYTGYFQRVAKDRLDLVMRLEADRMINLVLTDDVVIPERDVVLEERRTRTDNDPASQLHEMSRAALYLHHPYRIPVIGWRHEIEQLSTADALAFYRRYYAPNNAILVVAGDVTAAEVLPLAEKHYGAIPRGEIVPRRRVVEPDQTAPRRVELRSARVGQAQWSRNYLAPSYNAGERLHVHALQVLAEVLGAGPSSRLYKALVVEKPIATSVGAWYSPDRVDLGEFGVYGSPRPGVEIGEIEKAIEAEIARIVKDGVTEDEVALAKKRMLAQSVYVRDSLRAGPNVFGRTLAIGGTIADVEDWPERVRAVTVAQVNAAARHVVQPARSVTSTLLPERPS